MTFDDLVPEILAEEQAAGASRLHGWLAEQATWLSAQAYSVGDVELRERYLALRGAVEAWLWSALAVAKADTVAGADTDEHAGAVTDGDLALDDQRASDLETGGGQADEPADPPVESVQSGVTEALAATESDEKVSPPPPEKLLADALDSLWQDIAGTRKTAGYAAAFAATNPVPPETDPLQRATRLWKWIHLVCLRVPADVAEVLRARAWEAAAATANQPVRPNSQEDDLLIPPLPAAEYPGADVHYQLSPGPDEISAGDSVERMVGIAAHMTWLARHDPAVRVGWEVVNSGSTLVPFAADHLGTYDRRVETWQLRRPESGRRYPGQGG